LNQVTGDRYGSQWVVDAFRRVGVQYTASELTKSEIYVAAQPLFAQRRIELLDIPLLAGELRRLERRPCAGGRAQVDHPPGSHDDAANGACGALVLAASQPAPSVAIRSSVTHCLTEYEPMDDERRERGTSTVDERRGLLPKLPPIMYN